ncbi:MAG: DMT family transporter, partial [Ignavibacteriales bacterium]|nr:DMT family transporter [Ignavibacteriales bacterium]
MSFKSEKFLIIAGYTLVSLIWGSTWLGIKIGLESVPPFFGVALRFTVAFAILTTILLFQKQRVPLSRNDIFLYIQLGICSYSIPFALVYWGEQYIPSSLASILFAFYPFVVVMFSHYMLDREKINAYKLLGILSGFIGLFLIFGSDFDLSNANTHGMMAIIGSVLLQGMSLVLVKRYGKHIPPVAMNVGGMLVGLPIMFAIAFTVESFSNVRFDAKGILSILYLGTFGTVVTFVIYYWLLKRMQALFLSFISFITPILAVIFGTLVLDETLSPHIFSGAVLVLCGIAIANGKELLELLKLRK